jgi:PAS domain S-box-containing protein
MQSEELKRSHLELEASRDQYIDLYDFAPIGYLTLTHKGVIAKINLTAASMLGVQRSKLLNRYFASLLAPLSGDNWHLFVVGIMKDNKQRNIELIMKREDGSEFHAHLDCLCVTSADHDPMLRIVLIDITDRKMAENGIHRGREEPFGSPLPPNRASGFPAHGSPVSGFLFGMGSPTHGLSLG